MILPLLLLGCPSPPRAPAPDARDPGDTAPGGDTGDTDTGDPDTTDTAATDTASDDTGSGDSDTAASVPTCTSVVDSFVEVGDFSPIDGVDGVSGGWSREVGGTSYWVFREVGSAAVGSDGADLRAGVAAVLTDAVPDDGLDPLLVAEDAAGVPIELLADDATDDCAPEVAWGAVRSSPYSALAWVVDGEEALLFYAKTCASTGFRGQGLARWTPRAGVAPDRLRAGSGDDPEVLFPVDPDTELGEPPNFLPGRAALTVEVGGDTFVYAYACNVTFWSIQSCGVGRARWQDADDPAAWTVWNGEGWTAELGEMAFLLDTAAGGGFTVAWNEPIGAYVAWLPAGDSGVRVATAPAPEGPWTTPVTVAEPGGYVSDALAHSELGGPGVDYLTLTTDGRPGLWRVDFDCGG